MGKNGDYDICTLNKLGISYELYEIHVFIVLPARNDTFVGFSRRYITETFVDLYPVASMRGVYMASQLSRGKPGTRKIYTRISYDKGRAWDEVTVPERHANGSAINCPPVRSFTITRIHA